MPSNLLNADIGFPATEGKKPEQSMAEVVNYLYMLLEQLRYSFANLDRNNFNDEGFHEIARTINKPVLVRLEDTNQTVTELSVKAGELSSQISDTAGNLSRLTQKVDSFQLSVENGYRSSTLTLTAGGIALSSQEIEFSGVATFHSLRTPGATVIDGGNVTTGTISAISIFGCLISGSDFHVNMNAAGSTNGRIRFRYLEEEVGTITLDDRGSGTEDESRNRLFIETIRDFAIKIEASGGFSIRSGKGIYTWCWGDTVIETSNGDIYLKPRGNSGDVYIGNNTTLKEYIREVIAEETP